MTISAASLTTFLLARIAEDEAAARDDDAVPTPRGCLSPERVLAECEAKRPLLTQWQDASPDGDDWARVAWSAMCAWAVAYADHPDYIPEWRP